jgi:hypothetical protein
MTTTANKTALRAKAEARRKKAAQETPLPPKPTKGTRSRAAKESAETRAQQAMADAARTGNWKFYALATKAGAKTIHVIHVIGDGEEWGNCSRITRAAKAKRLEVDEWAVMERDAHTCQTCAAKDLAMRLTAGRKRPAADKPQPSTRRKAPAPRSAQPSHAGDAPTGSGGRAKAEALREFAVSAGWKADVTEPSPSRVLVAARREGERVLVNFIDDRLDLDQLPVWSNGERTVRLRNVSAAKKQMTATSDDNRPVRAAKRQQRRAKPETHEDQFADLGEQADELVLEAVRGQVLTWRNGISGVLQEARVPSKITEKTAYVQTHPKNGHRILSFFSVLRHERSDGEVVELPAGWRSVYVDKIMRIKDRAIDTDRPGEDDDE